MSAEIIIAGLSLLGTLAGTAGGIIVSGKLVNYRIEQLERRSKSTIISSPEPSGWSRQSRCWTSVSAWLTTAFPIWKRRKSSELEGAV